MHSPEDFHFFGLSDLGLSPYKYIFQSFGDCGTPPALNPLMLILYDSHNQNTPSCQFWTRLVQYSSSYERFCRFFLGVIGVSTVCSVPGLFHATCWYSQNASCQRASNDVFGFVCTWAIVEITAKNRSKSAFFDPLGTFSWSNWGKYIIITMNHALPRVDL